GGRPVAGNSAPIRMRGRPCSIAGAYCRQGRIRPFRRNTCKVTGDIRRQPRIRANAARERSVAGDRAQPPRSGVRNPPRRRRAAGPCVSALRHEGRWDAPGGGEEAPMQRLTLSGLAAALALAAAGCNGDDVERIREEQAELAEERREAERDIAEERREAERDIAEERRETREEIREDVRE